jgi:MoaA/NifB/PqqE/SkfB family radical SAM enzyme
MKIVPLQIATVTVNNGCNLACPHCYLQYEGTPDGIISDAYFRAILESSAERVILVGKEPLRDRPSVERTSRLIEWAFEEGKRVAMITNGQLLNLLPPDAAQCLDYIDVSFDGGPQTYQGFRGASYDRLARNIAGHADNVEFSALHVLCDENLEHVDDMMMVAQIPGVQCVCFSLFVEARTHGTITTRLRSVDRAIAALTQSRSFRECEDAVLILARHELGLQGDQADAYIRNLTETVLPNKVHVVEVDPLQLGIARFTYDGYALTPLDSVHPADYAKRGIRWEGQPISEVWCQLHNPLRVI